MDQCWRLKQCTEDDYWLFAGYKEEKQDFLAWVEQNHSSVLLSILWFGCNSHQLNLFKVYSFSSLPEIRFFRNLYCCTHRYIRSATVTLLFFFHTHTDTDPLIWLLCLSAIHFFPRSPEGRRHFASQNTGRAAGAGNLCCHSDQRAHLLPAIFIAEKRRNMARVLKDCKRNALQGCKYCIILDCK